MKTAALLISLIFINVLTRPCAAQQASGRMIPPDQWLKEQAAPTFRAGHTLLPLTPGYGTFDTFLDMAERWGYTLCWFPANDPNAWGPYATELNVANSLANPDSLNSRVIALVNSNPAKYKLSVMCSKYLPKRDAVPPEAWTRTADGRFVNRNGDPVDRADTPGAGLVWSPEAPESVWQEAGRLRADPLRRIREKCPIAIVLNGGEYGIGITGSDRKYWEQDPRIMKAKGKRSWYDYLSEKIGREQTIIADAIRKAVPDRLLYSFYVTADGWRNRDATQVDWSVDYKAIKTASDLPSSTLYYKGMFDVGWVWKPPFGDQLTMLLNSRGYDFECGTPLSYDWQCGGWAREGEDPLTSPHLSDIGLYMGFLKCFYVSGSLGGNAGYYGPNPLGPKTSWGASFDAATPPHWLRQIVALAEVHALFSHHEDYIRNGDLLPGPDKHRWSTKQPAYEFPTDGIARVLARKHKQRDEWLITAWAADGKDRDVSVTIPKLGKVKLRARGCGSVYLAKRGIGAFELKLLDENGLQPTPRQPAVMLASAASSSSAPVTPAAPAPTPAPATTAVRDLFNGRDTAGWTGPGGAAASSSWRIEGSTFSATQRAYLWSQERFSDFELEIEWKLAPNGNGGIFYHVPGTNELEGPELQLCDPSKAVGFGVGSLYGIVSEKRDASKPLGEWNTAKLVVAGPKREHWINGELVASYDLTSDEFKRAAAAYAAKIKPAFTTTTGKLVLQAYGGEVSYRNARIRTAGAPAPGAAFPATVSAVPAVSSASGNTANIATATKDAPFTNSLGMKFIPVPITGGPTAGQSVHFSVWLTRVQDYAEFAKAQEAAGKNVDGSWMAQDVAGVPVGREPDHPVVAVSWEDAQAFCAWLTAKEQTQGTLPPGAKYRLPSDEEWSWAVGLPPEALATPEAKHGMNSVDFPWGKDWPPTAKVGNYADEAFHAQFPKPDAKNPRIQNKWIQGYTDGYATTSPVGSFPANAHGLHDMGGNVWQWCEDWWNAGNKDRVLRGNSFPESNRDRMLSSVRHHAAPGVRFGNHGFRCVLAAMSAPVGTVAASPASQPPAMAVTAAQPQAPADPQLAALHTAWTARFDAEANKPFDTAIATLNTGYLRALENARATAKNNGALADVLALDAETKQIAANAGVPAADATDTPPALAKLRATYRAAHQLRATDRDAKLKQLRAQHLKAIEAHIIDLTKANKIDEAKRAQQFRDGLGR